MFILLFLMYTLSYCPIADHDPFYYSTGTKEQASTSYPAPGVGEFYSFWVEEPKSERKELKQAAIIAQTTKVRSQTKI